MNPKQALQTRFIYEQAILAGWVESVKGWKYPVYSPDNELIGYRQKAYPDTEQAKEKKYSWPKGKPKDPNAEWYTSKTAKEAIAKANGVAFIANGEPALLAYQAAGIENVIATTLSEIAVPKNINSYFQRMGISRALYPFDNDEAGYNSAIVWRDALAGSGIDFEALSWGLAAPEKADANDILIQVAGDGDKFRQILYALTPVSLPAPEPEQKPERRAAASDIDFSSIYSQIAGAIFEALSAKGQLTGRKFSNGFYQMRCIHHEDSQASAGFHPESGMINCFVCGKHKLKENAAALGLDWASYFPKSTPQKLSKAKAAKTPVKADLSNFDETIDQIGVSIEEKQPYSYEDAIDAEIMLLTAGYLAARKKAELKTAKQTASEEYLHLSQYDFFSWYAGELPISFLSAMLNLLPGRSSAIVLLGRMHRAFLSGELPPLYTIPKLADIVKMRKDTVRVAHAELEGIGLTRFLRTLKESKSVPPQSVLNSVTKPVSLYAIETNLADVHKTLMDMLERRIRERYTRRALSEMTGDMALQLGLNDEAMRQWKDRAADEIESPWNKAANRKVKTELEGDGGEWRGWYEALKNPYSFPIPWHIAEDSRDVRKLLFTHWIANVRQRNSREDLQRLLGLSDGAIDGIMAECNIISESQTYRIEADFKKKHYRLTHGKDEMGNVIVIEERKWLTPLTVEGMKSEFNRWQRTLRGKIWKGGFQVAGTEVEGKTPWQPVDDKSYLRDFARYAGRIQQAFFLINTPSVQRFMTDEEIQAREEQLEAERAALAASNPESETAPETGKNGVFDDLMADDKPNTGKTPQKGTISLETEDAEERVYSAGHLWEKHRYIWLYNQLRLMIYCYTDMVLSGDSIIAPDGEILMKGDCKAIAAWVNEHGSPKAIRSVAEFYGKAYNEAEDLKALQAIADANLAKLEMDAEGEDRLPTMQPMF